MRKHKQHINENGNAYIQMRCKKCNDYVRFYINRVQEFINTSKDKDRKAVAICQRCENETFWSVEQLAELINESDW